VLLIAFLAAILVVVSLVSMWKENRFGWPLRGIIWFTLSRLRGGWLRLRIPSSSVFNFMIGSWLLKLAAQSVKLFSDLGVVSFGILPRRFIHPFVYLFAGHGH
jgi:hypothetical protein